MSRIAENLFPARPVDIHAKNLTGRSALAAADSSIHKNPCTNAGSDCDEDEVFDAPSHSMRMFADGGHVGVIVEEDWTAKDLFEFLTNVDFAPTGDIVGIENLSGLRLNTSRHADRNPMERLSRWHQSSNTVANLRDHPTRTCL